MQNFMQEILQKQQWFINRDKANQARLKTASEFAMKNTNESSKFGQSVLRNVLIALYKSSKVVLNKSTRSLHNVPKIFQEIS